MAPEVALGQGYDLKADSYSFGALIYEVFTGVLPDTGKNFEKDIVHSFFIEFFPRYIQFLKASSINKIKTTLHYLLS